MTIAEEQYRHQVAMERARLMLDARRLFDSVGASPVIKGEAVVMTAEEERRILRDALGLD